MGDQQIIRVLNGKIVNIFINKQTVQKEIFDWGPGRRFQYFYDLDPDHDQQPLLLLCSAFFGVFEFSMTVDVIQEDRCSSRGMTRQKSEW